MTLEAFSFLRFAFATGSRPPHAPAAPALPPAAPGAPPPVEALSELARCPRVLDEDRLDLSRRPIAPLSRRNEAAVVAELGRLAAAALDGYPTAAAADAAELARAAPGSNRANALTLLLGEKATAAWLVALAREAGPLLAEPEPALARARLAAALARADAAGTVRTSAARDLGRYLRAVVVPLVEADIVGELPWSDAP